jgi:ribosomal protein S6--L-glutamate ligase
VIDQVENRLFVLKLLEEKGFPMVNPYGALVASKNKWFATECLRKAGVATVSTWVVEDEAMAFQTAQKMGYPVVVKMSYGTYGLGVAKAENEEELRGILGRFWKADFIQPILLQPFIAEAKGKDHRVFVVGDRVVASMERRAPAGDFRAYSPKVENALPIEISAQEKALAIAAVAAVGLDYAGVDIIETATGPAVLEVNGNAGLMRISGVTGVDVPRALIEFAVSRFLIGGREARRE